MQRWDIGCLSNIGDYVFRTFDITRIFAKPFGINIQSQKVLEKAGFIYEAILKKGLFKNGRYIDEWIYVKKIEDINSMATKSLSNTIKKRYREIDEDMKKELVNLLD